MLSLDEDEGIDDDSSDDADNAATSIERITKLIYKDGSLHHSKLAEDKLRSCCVLRHSQLDFSVDIFCLLDEVRV